MPLPLPADIDPQAWFVQAARRRALADLAVQAADFGPEAVELLQASAERYLKGFLLTRGWSLVKTHDLAGLLKTASQYDPRFAAFANWAVTLTSDFFIVHYPTDDWKEVGQDYEEIRRQTDEVIALIRELAPSYFDVPNSPRPPQA